MPFTKDWDNKVKVCVFPIKISKGVICHNCQCSFEKEYISMCTGLCVNCAIRNRAPSPRNSACDACAMVRCNPTNFGISRQLCATCQVEDHPLDQRCMACDKYADDCWNHVCSTCRGNKYLCEETGYFYSNMKHHFQKCWCLSHIRQKLRLDMQQMLSQRK